jgi:hypothetical protein
LAAASGTYPLALRRTLTVVNDDSAYERVTNPERFAALHEAARELVNDLRQRFDILVEATAPEADNLRSNVLSAVRVSPRNDGAAVTVALTDFPGLYVRFGSEHAETFPQCGCDACDEQPDQLAENLREKLESVAYGRFSEPAGGYDFVFDAGRESGGQSVRRFGRKPPTRHYDPWPPLVSG